MASSASEPVVPVGLTEPQRRHLRVFLHQIEAAVAEVVQLGGCALHDRILRLDVADLPPGFGLRIQPEVDRVRRGIETLAARFGLEPDRRSRLRRAQALLVTAMVELEDAGSRALKAYGGVDAAVPQELDPVLGEISRALDAMASMLLTPGAPPEHPGSLPTTASTPGGHLMHGFKGERTLMRIHIGERDKWHSRAVYEAIVDLLRKRHYAGVTVLRAIMGFGASSKLHTDRVEVLSLDLPVIIECVDTEERIAEILPELDEMIGGGLITLERARVIMYRPDLPPDARTASWEIDRTGRWQAEPPGEG